MNNQLLQKIRLLGLSDKAARMYLATLQLGGGTMQDLAKGAKVPRTSLYYTVQELMEIGALIESRLGKRKYYQAVPPKQLLMLAQDRLVEATEALPELEAEAGRGKSPAIEILHGPQGFKLAWDELLQTKEKEFRIITSGESFLDYVREKYVIRTIIGRKKMLKVKSYQLISDTPYGKEVVKKDSKENRESKLLPSHIKLPYTLIFSEEKVLVVSTRAENIVLMWNSPKLAMTLRSLFEEFWKNLK